MAYLGDFCGNGIALSYISAAVVTPMGIVSVVVAAVLAKIYLGEEITSTQRNGYTIMCLGIFIVLTVAPKGQPDLGNSIPEVFSKCRTPAFVFGLGLILCSIVGIIYQILIKKREKEMHLYVLVQALFGTVSIIASKVLSFCVKLLATSDKNSLNTKMLNDAFLDSHNKLLNSSKVAGTLHHIENSPSHSSKKQYIITSN